MMKIQLARFVLFCYLTGEIFSLFVVFIINLILTTMLTLLLIGAGGLATAVGTGCLLSDGEDHTSEMSEYENKHPYSTWEASQPYNP